MLLGEVLHQAGRHIRLTGTQGLLDRLVQAPLSAEPATGTQVQTRQRLRQLAGRIGTQQIGEQVVVTEPVALLVQRHQKHLMRLQVLEHGGTVMAIAHRIAQFGTEAIEAGGVIEKGLQLGRLALDHLFQQVIADHALGAVQTTLAFGGGEQPQAQASGPALAALQQVVQRLARQLGPLLGKQFTGLVEGQAQILLLQLQQLPRQA